MDLPSLFGALPADTIAAVASDPGGLTSTGQVYVSNSRRAATSDVEAWWRHPFTRETEERTPGGTIVRYLAELRVGGRGTSATIAQLESWADQLRGYFDGAQRPAGITDHFATTVDAYDYLEGDQRDTDRELLMVVSFVGTERHTV